MKRASLLAACAAAAVVLSYVPAAHAGWKVKDFQRWAGFGYGAGYHAREVYRGGFGQASLHAMGEPTPADYRWSPAPAMPQSMQAAPAAPVIVVPAQPSPVQTGPLPAPVETPAK